MPSSSLITVTVFPPSPKRSNDAATCSSMAELKQLHSRTIRLGLSGDNHAVGRLIKFCAVADSGDFSYALQLFDELPQPDAFVYNTMMRGQSRSLDNCLHFYSLMLTRSVPPNRFTFPSLIRACSRVGAGVETGREIHSHVLKLGFGDDPYCQNGLIHMYVGFGAVGEARKVFDRMPERDSASSWTSMISGYSRSGRVDEALELFRSVEPEKREPATWNAMIACLVKSRRISEAFDVFREMSAEGFELDKYSAATMLSACSRVGVTALSLGRKIHNSKLELDSKLAAALIDMYCKCGSVDEALAIFDSLPRGFRSTSSWNSMIGGLAMHGRGNLAVKLFHRMERESSVGPDKITLVNVLAACAHSGLVEEGLAIFTRMSEPGPEHFGCVADLLGRAGKFEEALEILTENPDEVSVIGALLGACRIHKNVELGEHVGERAIELEPENSGRYVVLANLYAEAGRYDDVARIRRLMESRGVTKVAGRSTVEFGGVVSEFVAGETTHPRSREIYEKLDDVLGRIATPSFGYEPDDEAKHHSEKLAIAYGLLMTRRGETIRVSKNLRVCRDCHVASKLISAAYDREIVVRDRNRFHHFKMGECSCKDYW